MRLFNSAREYHERTKYSYDDVKFVYQEFSAEPQPSHIKDYPGYPVVQLPQNYNLKNKNLTESLKESQSFNQFSKLKDSAVDLQKISQLLYLINGITLVREFPRKKILLRASPSASALYPTEIYLYANKVSGLESALYYFHPHKHQLIKINGANIGKELIEACYGLDFLKAAPAHLVFTSVFSRSSWKFKNRAYRYCLMDGGYIAQNLLLAAASLDLKSNLIGDFVDENVNNLLGIDW
jgi:SagB-type dehydrogenase family enzyme